MNILITGSHGFLGRHFVKKLTDQGHYVHGIDDLSNGLDFYNWPKHLLPDGNFIYQIADILEELPGREYDLVIHCAGIIGGRSVIDFDPVQHVKSIEIDAKFAQWFVKTRQKRLLYLSSSASYPVHLQEENSHTSLSEENHFIETLHGMPDMMYGWSKLSGEVMFKMLSKAYGFDVLCVRPFSGYGEDQGLEYPMAAISRRALAKEDPLTVWGSGNQGRDFIYVDDLVELALEQVMKTRGYDNINLGSGQITTFKELAKIIAEEAGYDPKIEGLSNKPEGVSFRLSDTNKMNSYGLKPKISLREGVKKVLNHIKSLSNEP